MASGPRPVYRYPPISVAVGAIVMVLAPTRKIEVLDPRLRGISLTVGAGPPGVRVTVPSTMTKGGSVTRMGM